MSSSKKIERFELRLRPNLAAESALLDSLEAKEGVYGGKTELLRDCVRRGYLALLETRSKLPPEASEDDILKAFTAEFSASGYSYRIGKLFLDAIDAVNNAPVQPDYRPDDVAAVEVQAKAPEAAAEQAPAAPQASIPSEAEAPSMPQALDPAAAQVEVPVPPQEETSEAPVAPAASQATEKATPEGGNDEGSSDAEPPARPRVNWGDRLGGLAGSRDAGTKKK